MLESDAGLTASMFALDPHRHHHHHHHHSHLGYGHHSGLMAGDGNGRSKRMRTSFKHHQLQAMKQYFNANHNPDAKDLKALAQKTGLTKRVLQVCLYSQTRFQRSR